MDLQAPRPRLGSPRPFVSRFRPFRVFALKESVAYLARSRAGAERGRAPLDFDALALDLARGVPRREVLRRLGSAVAAALLAPLASLLSLEPAPAAAAPAAAPPTPCQSAATLPCLDQAQGAFANALTGCYPESLDQGSLAYWLSDDQCLARAAQGYRLDQARCLGPGAGCPAGSECSSDLCCPAGQVGCGAVCCGAGQSCVNGQCSDGTSGGTTSSTSGCPAGQSLCGSACVNVQTDPNNCGSCGHPCGSSQRCQGGQCICSGSLTACGSSCVDLLADAGNCGHCGQACPAGSPNCCGGTCVNLQSAASHCGNCANACPTPAHATPSCAGGVCSYTCLPGYADCNHQAGDGCEVNTGSDPANCGTCRHACASGETCVNGQCTCGSGGDCGSGKLCCAGMCIDPTSDAANCGACGHGCGSGEGCCGGVCTPLNTSSHCGACGRSCPANSACVGGQCQCNAGYTPCGVGPAACCSSSEICQSSTGTCTAACAPAGADCSTVVCCSPGVCLSLLFNSMNKACFLPYGSACQSNGQCVGSACCSGTCVDGSNDSNNCGACGHVCPSGTQCKQGVCKLASGSSCQSAPQCQIGACTNGVCCLPLRSIGCHAQADCCGPGQCFGTGPVNTCLLPDGSPCQDGRDCANHACNNGFCCFTGQSPCPGSRCANLQTDPNNCGTCGKACPAGTVCCSGACANLSTDAINCGACGKVCLFGGTCRNGSCTCPAGFAVCSGNCVNLMTNPQNCGKCGTVCAQGGCAGGRCCVPSGGPCRAGGQCCAGQCIQDRCA